MREHIMIAEYSKRAVDDIRESWLDHLSSHILAVRRFIYSLVSYLLIVRWVVACPYEHVGLDLALNVLQGLIHCDHGNVTSHVRCAELPCNDFSSAPCAVTPAAVTLPTVSYGAFCVPWIHMEVCNMNQLESFSTSRIFSNIFIQRVYVVIILEETWFPNNYLLSCTVYINLYVFLISIT